MIYFIRKPDGSAIKIGTTIQLSQRLRSLVQEHGKGLEVLAVLDGSYGEERALHERFAHLRTVGEWFEPGDDLLGFIVSDGRPWEGEEPGRFVPIERDLLSKAKYIARQEGISVSKLLSDIIRPELDRQFRELARAANIPPRRATRCSS